MRALSLARQPEPRPAPQPEARPDPNFEMFVIRPAAPSAFDAVDALAEQLGGLVLMETDGAVIAALPSAAKDALDASPAVAFAGAITLDEEVDASAALKKRFAENAIRRLEERRPQPAMAGRG